MIAIACWKVVTLVIASLWIGAIILGYLAPLWLGHLQPLGTRRRNPRAREHTHLGGEPGEVTIRYHRSITNQGRRS
jgi:hypothetical protein